MSESSNPAGALRLAFILAFVLPFAQPSPAATPGCAGKVDCIENPAFAAEVIDFRNSTSGRYRVATATVRIHNRLDRPLALGYVADSGVVIDDQGNRYVINASGVRGIGVLGGNTVDTKFTLEPGESSDARFEFTWDPGRAVVGTKYDMDLTLREIDTIAGGQVKLGKERVLHFEGPGSHAPGSQANSSSALAQAPTAAPAAAAAAPALADPCAGLPRCASGGTFIAQVTSVTPVGTPQDRHHYLKLTVRFRNISNAPIYLGYKSGSNAATDNLGNGYIYGRPGTHDTSFSGMGLVTGRGADPSFRLNPGESRDAQFTVTRFNSGGKQLGTAWAYDVVVSGMEILPSQQVRVDREYSLHFGDLAAGGIAGVPTATPTVNDAVQGILNLLNKKK
jgi:hypothetical protein